MKLRLSRVAHLVFLNDSSTCRLAVVGHKVDLGCPGLESLGPSGRDSQWYDDEEWTLLTLFVHQPTQPTDCLNGFAETHLIRQHHILALTPIVSEEVETFELKLSELSVFDVIGLGAERSMCVFRSLLGFR